MTGAWIIAELAGERRGKKGRIDGLPRIAKFGKAIMALRFGKAVTILIIKEITIDKDQQPDIFIGTKDRMVATEGEKLALHARSSSEIIHPTDRNLMADGLRISVIKIRSIRLIHPP